MKVEQFTRTQERVLEALAVYRFLTSAQMQRVGVAKQRSDIYRALKDLRKRKRASIVAFPPPPPVPHGKLAGFYALTQDGADVLNERRPENERVEVHRKYNDFKSQYLHRLATVDLHIALRAWAGGQGAEVDFFETYFDPYVRGAKHFNPRTHIELSQEGFNSDAIFHFTTSDGAGRLCGVEIARGKRTAYVTKQVERYVSALDQEAIEKKYAYLHEARALFVFEEARGMALVGERVSSLPLFERFMPAIYAATLIDLQNDFRHHWQRFTGERTSLF